MVKSYMPRSGDDDEDDCTSSDPLSEKRGRIGSYTTAVEGGGRTVK